MADRREPDEQDKGLSPDPQKIAREGEKNRKALDEIPPPGTDPLHEGP